MAAVVLTKRQSQFTLSGKKKNKVKIVLCTPYEASSSKVKKDVETEVRRNLKKALACYKDVKKSDIKRDISLGVNETSRLLEKDQLQLVLIDKSANLIATHLQKLSAVRQCPCLTISNLEIEMIPILNISRLACLGFNKQCSAKLQGFIDSACRQAPDIQLPWIEFENTMCSQNNVSDEPVIVTNESVTATDDHVMESPLSDGDEDILTSDDDVDKDYSYLYTMKSSETTKPVVEVATFGDNLITFTADSDSDLDNPDSLEEFTTRAGRIKLFPRRQKKARSWVSKGKPPKRFQRVFTGDEVKYELDGKAITKKEFNKLKFGDKKANARSKKIRLERKAIKIASEAESHYKTVNVGRLKSNPNRKPKKLKSKKAK